MRPSTAQLEYFTSERSRELLEQLDGARIPRHVAIIMDGNGRWAAAHGKPRLTGHKAGVGAVRDAIATAVELKIGFLTLYSFSSENWSRPAEEVAGIMSLFVEVLSREVPNLNAQNVRVRVIGDMESLPPRTKQAFDSCMAATAGNTGLTLVVALNYGARQDVVSAARTLARRVAEGSLSADDIDIETFSGALSTAGIPDPDLLVRTSGEMRISNFLLWEIAYSELYVTDTYWPDFGPDEFLAALVEFQSRQRRFGGL